MTSHPKLGRIGLTLMLGALVAGACGGPSVSPAATAVVTPAPQTFAPTPTAVAVTPAATVAPSASAVDPSDDLEIGAPYAIEPMEPALAEMFITAMQNSLGELAPLLQVGAKSAVVDGDTVAWIIAMRIPDLPISETALLDGAAEGGAGTTGTIEEITIDGHDVRVIENVTGGTTLYSVLAMVDGDMVMTIGAVKADCINVMTSLLSSNG
jgi:hypothetical protein